ncbi:DUF2953 domain-containing protein [Butyrivibrio sp. VCB2001]|uniref:DUF2953 domain-containing protein n=1 Tax=Butyrivibrio sp. VCB2001 TaxID=1280667 RepID=UPI0003F57D5C|nr:DUF2953 domain-containing protein [Butyrivibrio sp. VCB2001]
MLLTGVLTVLKIIGIVLLVILAVILLLLLLVLFAPIFYRIDANIPETELDNSFDMEKVFAKVSFHWLLFVIRGGIEFPKNKEFTLRVFGIKILPKKEKPEKEDKKKDKDKDKEKETDEKPVEDKPSEEKKEEEKPEDVKPSEEVTDSEASETDSELETETEDDEPKSFLDVLWNIIDKIDNILKTPLNVFEKIRYTISRVCDKIDMIKSTLENDIFKRAFALVKKKLIKIIKMILPDKYDIDLMLGTGDPAQTAEIMAGYGALYPYLYKKVRFEPDFERKVIMTDAHIKGHITLFTIVYSAAVCYFNKDVKKTIKRFKKIINS